MDPIIADGYRHLYMWASAPCGSGTQTGHADGTFKTSYSASRNGFFLTRAYYYGVALTATSDKQYFRVR